MIPTGISSTLTNTVAVPAASDPTPSNNTATATVKVLTPEPPNHPPIATADFATTSEDTSVTIEVVSNDSDPDPDPLRVSGSGTSALGSFTCSGLRCVYTPTPNGYGTDTFTYTLDDGRGGTGSAVVTVTITPVNDPPVLAAIGDLALDETDVRDVPVVATDVDDTSLTLTAANLPDFVTLADRGNGTGTLSLAPGYDDAGVRGPIVVTVTDMAGATDSEPISIVVGDVNRDPVLAIPGDVTVDEGTTRVVTVTASDPDGGSVAITATGLPSFTTFVDNQDGTGTLAISPSFNAAGTYPGITLTVADSNAATATKTFHIEVVDVNRAPAASSQSLSTPQGVSVAIVLAGTDPDGDPLTFTYQQPAHGTLSGTGSTLTYTPGAIYSGTDTFTFTVDDGHGHPAQGTVTITVTPMPATVDGLLVSADGARTTNVHALDGQTFRRGEPIYAFVGPPNKVSDIKRVTFWIDDTTRTGSPFSIEDLPEFDLARTADNGRAYPLESSLLTLGAHTVTARIEYKQAPARVLTATIMIADTVTHQLQVSTRPDRTNAVALNGSRLSGDRYIFLGNQDDEISGLDRVVFTLDGKQVSTEYDVNYDLATTSSNGKALAFNTRKLKDGPHELVTTVYLDGDGVKVVYRAKFTVDN